MSNLTISLLFVSMLTLLMWVSQVSINHINPGINEQYNCKSAIMITGFDKNDCIGLPTLEDDDSFLKDKLPSGAGSIEPTTGNVFVDSFASIKNWFVSKTKLDYIYSILTSPYTILLSMGVPGEIAFGIGALWYGLNLFLLVSFFWGRDA